MLKFFLVVVYTYISLLSNDYLTEYQFKIIYSKYNNIFSSVKIIDYFAVKLSIILLKK